MEQRYPNPYLVDYAGVVYRICWKAVNGGYTALVRRPGKDPWRIQTPMPLDELIDYIVTVKIPKNVARSNGGANLNARPVEDNFMAFVHREFNNIAKTYGWHPERESTAEKYRNSIFNQLAPSFPHDVSLMDLRRSHCEAALDRLEKIFRAKRPNASFEGRRRDLAWLIYAVFEYALSIHEIAKNPIERIPRVHNRLPYIAANARRIRLTRKAFSSREMGMLWNAICAGHMQQGELIGIALMMLTGVRTSEACALSYGDLVENAEYPGEYSIRVTSQMRKGIAELTGTLKTPAGYRMVPLIPPLAEILLQRREHFRQKLRCPSMDPLPLACRDDDGTQRCSPAELNECARILFNFGGSSDGYAKRCMSMPDSLAAMEAEGDGGGKAVEDEDRKATAYTLRKTALTLFTAGAGLDHMESAYLMGHSLKIYSSGARTNIARDYAKDEKQHAMLSRLINASIWLRQPPNLSEPVSVAHGGRHYFASRNSINLTTALAGGKESRMMVRALDPNETIRIRIRGKGEEDITVLALPQTKGVMDERDDISPYHLIRQVGEPFGSAQAEDIIDQEIKAVSEDAAGNRQDLGVSTAQGANKPQDTKDTTGQDEKKPDSGTAQDGDDPPDTAPAPQGERKKPSQQLTPEERQARKARREKLGKLIREAAKSGSSIHMHQSAVAAISSDGFICRMRFGERYEKANLESARSRKGFTTLTGLARDSGRELAATCDAEDGTVLITISTDGSLQCIESSRFAVHGNYVKGARLMKLGNGAAVAAVRTCEKSLCYSASKLRMERSPTWAAIRETNAFPFVIADLCSRFIGGARRDSRVSQQRRRRPPYSSRL